MLGHGLASALLAAIHLAGGAAPPCDAETRARLLAPAASADDAVALACSLRLGPGDRVTKRIVLEGSRASGTDLDCAGATIGRAAAQPSFPNATIEIRSVARTRDGVAEWDRPSDIRIRNCSVEGPIRIWGMGRNGQAKALKLSSRRLGHIERAQAAAPTRVSIVGSRLEAHGGTPLYLGPGVTETTLQGSSITGEATAIAVYLDAESARNTLADNSFDIRTGREVIAVDGSAHNRITGNRFRIAWRGGVYLYRNCGEGGTIRHQTPSFNTISGNRFSYRFPLHLPAVSVGARDWWPQLYCGDDAGYPFGSSADDGDNPTGNDVRDNVVE